jgi:hypothetical protein
VSSAALAETSVTLKQAGFSIKQTRDALEALALVDLAPTFEGQKQAAEGLIAAFRQFDLQSRDFKGSLSSINAVAAEFAVESSDIVTAIQKAGGAFKVSAGDMKTGSQALNEFVALFTSVRDTTRESADSIATGLRTVFTRLQRQDTVAALKDLGINLRYTREEAGKLGQSNLENQFVGAYEAVRRLSEGLAGLRTTDPRYSQVVEQLGGYRQISRVIPLLQQFETAQKALNIAQAGQLSLQAAAEKRQETLAARTSKLKEEYLDLFRKIVDSKGFQSLASSLLVVGNAFKGLLDAARPLLPLLTALAAIKIGTNIGGIFGGFARSFVAAPGASAVKKFASGGFVGGSGNNDTEPALLMPGEFVLNKNAVARMGVPNLRDLNEGRSRFHIKRYAGGSTDPVGGSYENLRRRVQEQRTVFSERLEASTNAAKEYNARQKYGSTPEAELEALGKECDRLAEDFRKARDELRGLTDAMYAAKGQVAPRYAVYHDDGRGNKKVLGQSDNLTTLDEINRSVPSYANSTFRGDPTVTTGVPIVPGSKEYAASATAYGTGGAPDQRVFVGYAPGAAPGTALPAVAQRGELLPGNLSPGQVRLAALRASRANARVDQSQVEQASFDGSIGQFIAAKDREDTSAAVRGDTSAAEAARSRAAQQAEVQALKPQSNIAALGINQLPQDQQVRFYQMVEKVVQAAQKHAETRGRAGEGASTGGDLDDFVTEYFAKNTFPKIDPTRSTGEVSNFVRRAGVQAAQAFFTKQGRFQAAGVFDESQDATGRELAPQDAILSPGTDPEDEQRKAARRQQQQLAQVTAALGGKLPENHQEMVAAAKALGVSAKVAHTATGAGTDSAGNITNVLAAAVRSQLGNTTTAEDLAILAAGGVDPNNPTATRPTALPGGAGRRPPRPPKAPPTGGAPDPFDDYRRKYPDEAAYQDAALAANDEERARQQLARYDRFRAEQARTRRAQDAQTRAVRQGYAAAPGPDGRPVGDRFPVGSAEREQEAFQLAQLAAARTRYGDQYGVPGDELAENRRQGRAEAIRDTHAYEYEQARRAANNTHVDPLVVANQTRRQRFDAAQAAREQAAAEAQARQLAVAARANASGGERTPTGAGFSNTLLPTTIIGSANGREVRTQGVTTVTQVTNHQTAPTTVGDRIIARQARDAAGIAGVTDPLEIKQAAIRAFENGEGGNDILDTIRPQLSPAQFAQVQQAARRAGFGATPSGNSAVSLFGQVPVTDPYSGAAQVGPDGKPVVRNVGLLAERAKALANQRITERGGADNLSDSTRAVVESQALAEHENSVRRELISAQENLLKLLQPNMTALERQTKAIEEAEKTLSGQTKVVKDQSGKLLGTEEQVNRATARGVQAPGAGGFVYGLQQRFGGYIDSAREFARNNMATRANARWARFTNTPTFGYAAAGPGAAGAYAANALDQRAGTADDAVGTDAGTASYKGYKGASGAVSLGLAGAAAGFAVGGPVGAAVGAIAGAGYGLYSALQDAEKDIREAKIGNALAELGTKLSAFATGLPDFNTTSGIGGLLDTYDKEANQRAFDAANGFFSFDESAFVQFRNKDLRKEVGPLLPQIGQGLNAQATRAGRDNPNARAGDELDTVVRDLLGRGQNRRLLGVVAQLRGTTVGDEERGIRDAVVKGQETERIARENRAGQNGVTSSINSFDRLTKALQASADGLSGLQQRAAALSDVFDGTITAARVSANAEALDQFGRGDNGALAPLDIMSAATGELGGQLRAAGGATNSVRASLDRVLPTVIANAGIESGDVTTEVSRGLYRDLGYGDDPTKAPREIQRTIAAVVAQLNHAQDGGRGLGGILNEVQVDASKFNDQLVSAMSDPIKEFGQRAAKQLEENANRFIDGLATLAQRTQAVGQLYDQLAQVRAGNFRTQFQTEQERVGRGNEGFGRASIDQLEQAFNARQQRLAGNIAFDPAAIGRQLGSVRTQVQEATERQQAAFASSGGNSAAFQQAAQEVVRLKDRAANLQQALRNLADVAERSAVIQEKLNRLKQEEDGRLGIAERFATAGYEERARINQGFVLANQAANRGTLDGFGADQQRQIVEALRSAGGVTLTGFNGSPRADDLLRNLLSHSFGGAFRLTGDQQRERAGLQGQLAQRGATAEQALSELIKHQEDANQKFFDNLRQQQTQFFAQLSALLLRNRLGDVENQIAGAAVRQRELQDGGGRARDLLARVGVTTGDQLTALRGRRGDLDEYRSLLAERTHRVSAIDAATAGLTDRAFGDVRYAARGQGLADYLTGLEFDGATVGRVGDRARALAGEEKYGGGGLVADSNRRITEVRGRLAGISGVNAEAIGQVLGGPEAESTPPAARWSTARMAAPSSGGPRPRLPRR